MTGRLVPGGLSYLIPNTRCAAWRKALDPVPVTVVYGLMAVCSAVSVHLGKLSVLLVTSAALVFLGSPGWAQSSTTTTEPQGDVTAAPAGQSRGKRSLWLLVGVDYHYIHWKFGATIAPGSIRKEPSEDFYAQTFPLPVLGVRYSTRLSGTWSLELGGDGFRASHWRHWNDEGGPIHTSSAIFDAVGTVNWRGDGNWFSEFGYRFNYYTLDETGPEDGNHLQARTHGPVARVGYSF